MYKYSSQVYSSGSNFSNKAEGQISAWSSCVPARLCGAWWLPCDCIFPDNTTLICNYYRYFTSAFLLLQPAEEIQPEKSVLLFLLSALLKAAGIRCQLCEAEPWHFPHWENLHRHRNKYLHVSGCVQELSLCLSAAVDPGPQKGRKFQKEIILQPPAVILILWGA